jgi:hypothetical protein
VTIVDQSTNPYEEYLQYWDAGWRGILPLPYGQKSYPPKGWTGHDGVDTSFPDCLTFLEDGQQNICLRMPANVVGVDVDHYGDKTGGDTLTQLVEKFGALPPTIMSTSRDDGISGIRLYQIPAGSVLPSKLDGIEFVQRHHRYAVVWPSIHPSGRTYQWIDERTGKPCDIPNIADLPELPARWVNGLVTDAKEHAVKANINNDQAANILAQMPQGDPCQHMTQAAGKALAAGDRHDSYNEAVLAAIGYGRRGCPGIHPTIKRLAAAFVSEISDPSTGRATRSEAQAEFGRSLMGALAIVAGETQGNTCPDDVLEWVESLPTPPKTEHTATDDDHSDPNPEPKPEPEPAELTPYERLVRSKFVDLRINDDAKAMLQTLKAGQAPPLSGLNLTDFLAEVEDVEQYRVTDMWPSQGRVLLAAQAKSGKTTMVAANLLPCLVDGGQFLGRYEVEKVNRRVVYLNMEVGTRTMRRWLADAGIVNTAAITVANLRGKASALSLASEAGRKQLGTWLASQDAEVVILDPLAPVLASLGLDENSNADVATFFAWWSEALMHGGVIDDLVVHHAGHGGERSRGASRLLDEPDAVWTLTKDGEAKAVTDDDPFADTSPTRYLSAYGRDVEMPAEALAFDATTRHLSLTGMSKAQVGKGDIERIAKTIMQDMKLRTKETLINQIGGNRKNTGAAIQALVDDGTFHAVAKSGNGWLLQYIPELGTDPRDLVSENA